MPSKLELSELEAVAFELSIQIEWRFVSIAVVKANTHAGSETRTAFFSPLPTKGQTAHAVYNVIFIILASVVVCLCAFAVAVVNSSSHCLQVGLPQAMPSPPSIHAALASEAEASIAVDSLPQKKPQPFPVCMSHTWHYRWTAEDATHG